MQRFSIVLKTLLSTIAVGATVVASFYFAYLLLLLLVLGVAGGIFWFFYSYDGSKPWFDEND